MANISTDFNVWSATPASNQPDSTDTSTVQADLQALQAALKIIFPNIGAALTPTHTELNYVDGVTSAIQTQLNAISASITSAPFIDSTALLKGSVDATKLVKFEVDGLTTATTRTLTVQDANGTVALVDSQTFTGTPTLPTGTIATTQTAGNNSTKIATTAYVDTSAIGFGQTWQSFTSPTRQAATTYTNSTGKPIQVSISTNTSGGTGNTLTVGGVIVGSQSNGNASGTNSTITVIVPNSTTYILSTGGTVTYWAELR